jgi:hypothetical protein
MELWARVLGLNDAAGRTPGLRRVGDLPDAAPWNEGPCYHREHSPPSMIVLPEGMYEHVCPGCGHVTRFTVQRPRHGACVPATCGMGFNLGFSLGQALGQST